MADTHYVPVSEQRYARILQTLENHPAPLDWNRAGVTMLADSLDTLADSTGELGKNDTPIVMAVDLLLGLAINLRSAVRFNPPQIAARLASFVRRDL